MKKILLATGILSAVFLVLLLRNSISNSSEKSFFEKEENEKQNAIGYAKWWNDIRANDITGEVSMTDVLLAREAADEQSGIRNIGLVWEEMGPDNIGGRTRAVLYDKFQTDVVWAGGVSGGLWKSVNSGQTWTRVSALSEMLNIASLGQGIDGALYVGTGEGLYSNFGTGAGGFPGNGIYKSTDGGQTFTNIVSAATTNSPSAEWAQVNRIACSPNDANIVYAGTNRGLKRSTNGGSTWTTMAVISSVSSVKDVKIGGDGYVYACGAGNTARYYRSTTPDGTTFESRMGIGGYAPASPSPIRIEFAVSPSNPLVVYSLLSKSSGALQAVYKSTDGGLNWTNIGPGSAGFNILGTDSYSQGDYDIALGVQPDDPDVVYAGGVLYIWRYTPSTGWNQISAPFGSSGFPYYIHPDQHAIAFDPTNPNEMIVGCDGGMYRSVNIKSSEPTFQSVNRNYNVTQFYSVGAATSGEVMGGTQDNGTLYINFQGNTSMEAQNIYGGDGGYSEIARFNSAAIFAGSPYGNLARSASYGSSFSDFLDCRIDYAPANGSGCGGDGVIDEDGEFVTPFTLWEDEGNGDTSYFVAGSNDAVWFTKGALNFSIVPDWFRFPDANGALTCMTFSPDGNHVFAGTNNGVVYRYSNLRDMDMAGKFLYPSSSTSAAGWDGVDSGLFVSTATIATGRYIRSIAVDPNNYSKIVVCAGEYSNTTYVWRSQNALDTIMTFTSIQANLPKMPVYSVCIPRNNSNILVAGTELGVWSYDFGTSQWSEENTGMERVPTLMVRYVPYYGQNYLYIGTHGRGIFRSSTLVGINDPDNNSVFNMNVYPNPVNNSASLQIDMKQSTAGALNIYNLEGKLVKSIDMNLHAGKNNITINTTSFASGSYIVSLIAGGTAVNRKMIVVR